MNEPEFYVQFQKTLYSYWLIYNKGFYEEDRIRKEQRLKKGKSAQKQSQFENK